MIVLLLGVATLLVLMGALGMFSRAQIATLKSLGVWIVALGGLVMAAMLFLTGRGAIAIAALAMLGPLVWSWMRESGAAPKRPVAGSTGPMSRAEAYEVLGLKPGASAAEIRAAHLRLMRTAHPDTGGSDWLAARINQARDILLS
jgi:DnaJ family protein C protein 19